MTRLPSLAVVVVAMASFTPVSHAAPIMYTAVLTGPNESPPTASPGTGFARVDFDIAARTIRVQANFANLVSPTVAAHIHGPTSVPGVGNAAVATQLPAFIGFPLGVMSGTYDQTFDTSQASTYNPAFIAASGGTVAGAEAALAASLAAGTAYFNIHSTVYPAGEIRGFLLEVPPEGSFADSIRPTTGGEGSFGYGRAHGFVALLGPFPNGAGSLLVVNVSHRQISEGDARQKTASASAGENMLLGWVLASGLALACLATVAGKMRA